MGIKYEIPIEQHTLELVSHGINRGKVYYDGKLVADKKTWSPKPRFPFEIEKNGNIIKYEIIVDSNWSGNFVIKVFENGTEISRGAYSIFRGGKPIENKADVETDLKKIKNDSPYFKLITSKEEALKIIKESSLGFIFVGILLCVVGFFIAPALIIDGIAYSILGLLLKLKSRIVAILLLLLSSGSLVMTLLKIFNVGNVPGGYNIVVAVGVFWAAIKSVEATFKLQNKFKKQENKPLTKQ